MKATCLENLTFCLVLDAIAAGPEADEFVHLLCLPDAGDLSGSSPTRGPAPCSARGPAARC